MEQVKASGWLTRWLRSESFWQGIVIQTLGTLAAAIIIALVAIFSGVGYTPAIRYFVIFGIAMISGFILMGFVGYLLWKWFDFKVEDLRERRGHVPRWLDALDTLSGGIIGALAVLILIIFAPLIRETIANWTGYIP